MEEAVLVLEKAESVLMKRIRAMKDSSPKWAAAHRLNEIRDALKLIKAYNRDVEAFKADVDAAIVEELMHNPPIAQA